MLETSAHSLKQNEYCTVQLFCLSAFLKMQVNRDLEPNLYLLRLRHPFQFRVCSFGDAPDHGGHFELTEWRLPEVSKGDGCRCKCCAVP